MNYHTEPPMVLPVTIITGDFFKIISEDEG
jgi:hypothetical protein